ncbi:hypothetical protein [Paenibacillus pinihumi]|uniref:phage scaffolding protein n=1 Tax=Paenibacillus pinihumi TaxID=669462 RepID=UPI000428630E|nr:hypothetical protein [Paenibacillus pinihumi]
MTNEDMQRKYMLTLDLQTFSEGDPDPEPMSPITEPEPKPLTMTQDELDALIAKRLGQERKKFSDYDELKSKLTEFETAESERQKAAMTEQERVQAELTAAKKAAEEAEGKSAAALKAANDRVIKADFKLAAASVNIRPDALEDAFLLADKAGITVDDEGNVAGVKEALEALVAAKPYLVEVATPNKPKTIGEPNNPVQEQRKTLEAQLEDAKKRKDFGKVVELSNTLANLK